MSDLIDHSARQDGRRANHVSAHTPHRSSTLMRHAVAKPGYSLKRQVRLSGSLSGHHKSDQPSSARLHSQPERHDKRLNRPVGKSPLISRFSKQTAIAHGGSSARTITGTVTASQAKLEPLPTNTDDKLGNLLEDALAAASAHKQPQLTKGARPRLSGLAITALLILVVSGCVFGQSLTNNVKLEYAGTKAGFTPDLPSKLPAGFSMSKVSYGTDQVITVFKDNSSSGGYKITQWPYRLTSVSVANMVMAKDPRYTTVNDNGNQIYLYGNDNAAWTSDGLLYDVVSNGSLSQQALLQMGASS